MRVALAAAVLALAAACGSPTTTTPPPPTDSGGSGGGSGGGGSGGGGGDTSGGQPAGGSGGGGSSGGDTSGGGGSAPAGGSGGDSGGGTAGGSGGGGSGGGAAQPPAPSDSSATVTRLDSSPECDGLLPSKVPAPVSVAVPPHPSTYAACDRGTSEGGGHVAVTAFISPGGFTAWQFLSPDGQLEKATDVESPLYPQANGWQGAIHGLSGGSSSFPVHVLTLAGDGSFIRYQGSSDATVIGGAWRLYESAPGGSLLMTQPATGCQVVRIGADGARVGTPAPTGCAPVAGAVATTGEALVLSGDGDVQWIAPDGTALAQGKDAALQGQSFFDPQLVPLLGGSLAFRGPSWTRTFDRLSLASAPAPDWLTSRARWTVRITGGNRGYAMMPPPCQALATCDQSLDVVAPSGRLCGRVTFHRDGPCSTGWLDQGWDGTVVQQTGCGFCTYRWWPRLLAGN